MKERQRFNIVNDYFPPPDQNKDTAQSSVTVASPDQLENQFLAANRFVVLHMVHSLFSCQRLPEAEKYFFPLLILTALMAVLPGKSVQLQRTLRILRPTFFSFKKRNEIFYFRA